MKIFAISVSLCIAVLLSGCGDSPSDPSGPVDYFPILAGNTWNCGFTGFVLIGADTITLTGTTVNTILGTTTHTGGFDVWKFRMIENITYTAGDTTWAEVDTTFTYTFSSDSEIVAYDDTLSFDYEIIMKLPVTVGESWVPDADRPDVTRSVESISESVSVPAGNFTGCLHLSDSDSQAPGYAIDMWLAPEVGHCKMIGDSSGVMHLEIELGSYTVN